MEIILLEDVDHLGSMGALVKVRPGFARNYLLPKKLAKEASKKNKRQMEHDQRLATHLRAKATAAAAALKAKIAGVRVKIVRKVGEQNKLFGSVTAHDVHAALVAEGLKVERRKVELHDPIKELGEFKVDVRLAATVKATVTVEVVAE